MVFWSDWSVELVVIIGDVASHQDKDGIEIQGKVHTRTPLIVRLHHHLLPQGLLPPRPRHHLPHLSPPLLLQRQNHLRGSPRGLLSENGRKSVSRGGA